MKSALIRLLASVAIAMCFAGCSPSGKGQHPASAFDKVLGLEPTPQDLVFAQTHEATWITTNLPATDSTFTVDFQDGLYSEGSALACALWVNDIQRENGVLLLTGITFSTPFNFEIEITTNMLATIRAAGGKFSFVKIAFRVESFKRIETESSDSSENSSDRYLLRGKAVAIEPISEAELKQK